MTAPLPVDEDLRTTAQQLVHAAGMYVARVASVSLKGGDLVVSSRAVKQSSLDHAREACLVAEEVSSRFEPRSDPTRCAPPASSCVPLGADHAERAEVRLAERARQRATIMFRCEGQ
ncbi:hypothetical protein [Streptomyces mirabilis]|uniref:hypothetical protein n=1 Tax=Streptomyces mirabilis TaxID=68239 RepID=UPI0036B9D025